MSELSINEQLPIEVLEHIVFYTSPLTRDNLLITSKRMYDLLRAFRIKEIQALQKNLLIHMIKEEKDVASEIDYDLTEKLMKILLEIELVKINPPPSLKQRLFNLFPLNKFTVKATQELFISTLFLMHLSSTIISLSMEMYYDDSFYIKDKLLNHPAILSKFILSCDQQHPNASDCQALLDEGWNVTPKILSIALTQAINVAVIGLHGFRFYPLVNFFGSLLSSARPPLVADLSNNLASQLIDLENKSSELKINLKVDGAQTIEACTRSLSSKLSKQVHHFKNGALLSKSPGSLLNDSQCFTLWRKEVKAVIEQRETKSISAPRLPYL